MAYMPNPFNEVATEEATPDVRRLVAADGKAGWFEREDSINCYRRLWDFEGTGAVDAITYEANRPRFHCAGFYRHSHGRTPKEHLTLEGERRGFGYQKKLAWLAFFGGLAGALLGAAAQKWFT